jgi:hypothetical protein
LFFFVADLLLGVLTKKNHLSPLSRISNKHGAFGQVRAGDRVTHTKALTFFNAWWA